MGKIATTTLLLVCSVCACTESEPDLPHGPRLVGLPDDDAKPTRGSALVGDVFHAGEDPALRVAPAPPGGSVVRTRQEPAEREELTLRVSPVARELLGAALEVPFESAFPEWDLVPLRSSDRGAIEEVMLGRAAAALVATTPSDSERAQGVRGHMLGHHILSVVVHPQNPLTSLPAAVLRQVLAGQTNEWRLVTYQRGSIEIVLGPVGPMAQRAESLLIPGDKFDSDATRLDTWGEIPGRVARNKLMVGVIGLASVPDDGSVRAVALDGVRPHAGDFEFGRYPHGCRVQLVHVGRPGPGARDLLDFLASEEGLALRRARLSVR